MKKSRSRLERRSDLGPCGGSCLRSLPLSEWTLRSLFRKIFHWLRGATTRFVDSSIERLEVNATNIIPSRHLLICNGQSVPLRSTDRVNEAVAGVRYRAWQPPSCLHPTIPVDTPLQFDLLDKSTGRSLGSPNSAVR